MSDHVLFRIVGKNEKSQVFGLVVTNVICERID